MDDFSGLEYDQDSITDEDIITKTNNLLNQFNLPTQVTRISDITASLFVVLYESLFSDRLPGIIRQPVTREDEVHNCQTVIDILSADVIKDNLSHIRGEDIVDGKLQAISNLVDIFTFLFEYVIKQIESDAPSDTDAGADEADESRSAVQPEAVDDLDTLSPEHVRRALEKDKSEPLGWGGRAGRIGEKGLPKRPPSATSAVEKANQPVPAARSRGPSNEQLYHPDKPNLADSGALDSTEELIREGQAVEKRLRDHKSDTKIVWDDSRRTGAQGAPGQFDFIGVRPVPTQAPISAVPTSVAPTTVAQSRSGATTATTISSSHGELLAAMPTSGPNFLHPDVLGHQTNRMAHISSSENTSNLSATMPAKRENKKLSAANQDDKLRATVGPIHYHSRLAAEKPLQYSEDSGEPVKGLSSSYGDLHHMVQRTAAITRAAINSSPMRMRRDRQEELNITDLSGERYQVPPSEAMKLAQDLNLPPTEPALRDPRSIGDTDELKKVAKKMEPSRMEAARDLPFRDQQPVPLDLPPRLDAREKHFLETKDAAPSSRYHGAKDFSTSPQARQQYRYEPKDYASPGHHSQAARPKKEHRGRQPRSKYEAGYLTDSDHEHDAFAQKRRHRYRDVVEDVMSEADEEAAARAAQWAAINKERQAKLSQLLHQMGKTGLADAQRHLETEDQAFRQKQDFLKKMYRDQYEDVRGEVKSHFDRERKVLRGMDTEYKQLLQAAAAAALRKPPVRKSRTATKPKGFLRKSRRAHTVSSKVRRRSSSTGQVAEGRERPLTLGEDEDLMPILLEEFPHLYMSEHTWHELWRHGIAQIENLTRAYEESKRRKSKAQQQVEEAAKRHEILANIVKKQLEHNKRMRDINDQRKQQAMVKNKTHEKRVQSARARRYYNEYQVRARSKMLKRRSREEMIFKNLFKDGLAIQKERIRELRGYAKEQRDKQAQRRQDEIDSLENFYRDQFEMLVERIAKDREDLVVRERAQQKALDKMKKDLRQKMEKEIVDIQSQLFRDEDDTYYRQLDADRLRHELQLAKYQTRV